ncbi:hypothetical protein D0N37_09140 [Pseudoalteromonas piscicida]|nr:hypothetical protein D0N37_09140 [Pseudoalteromonas piscicida]
MPVKRCPLGSPECALFIVAQLLPRLLGGKSSVASKTHSEEQKSNSKGQQALVTRCLLSKVTSLRLCLPINTATTKLIKETKRPINIVPS